jgi:2-keto-myo-inositol isomerase
MIDKNRIGLNRIIAPRLGLAEFYDFAASLGIYKVELRNDLGGSSDPIDGLQAAEAVHLATDKNIRVISINALQKFNLASARKTAEAELGRLLELAQALACPAIVLCPNNDASDSRNQAQRTAETADALAAFGPKFVAAGVLGYVEPLGFTISSLASLVEAQAAIRKSGYSCYRTVIDTFHHYIGPENQSIFGSGYAIGTTGLVHISGVEAEIEISAYRDEHRILIGPGDKMKSRELIKRLDELGYRGDFSFEPFSPTIQNLTTRELTEAIQSSLGYLLG